MVPGDMAGKAALVTGAASGLGRATAITLARAGADVCIVDINAEALEETAELIRVMGCRTHVHSADLSELDACSTAISATVGAFGRLDALCNVAGVVKFAHATEMSAADWNRTIAVNLSAPFFLAQAAIPHLLATEGAIVNVTSTASFIGEAYLAAYCASKAGLTHMTKALAMEYAHRPIRINAVAPGGMDTNITAGMTAPPDMDRALIARYLGLRGMVEVDDVAQVIGYLASEAGRGFHGACITIDRGVTAG